MKRNIRLWETGIKLDYYFYIIKLFLNKYELRLLLYLFCYFRNLYSKVTKDGVLAILSILLGKQALQYYINNK